MAGFDDALERLVTDPGFRTRMEQDPQAALADYDLTDDERQLLTSQLSHEAGASGGVEQRTSKSGLAGALGMFDDAVGAAAPGDAGTDSVEMQLPDSGTHRAGGFKDEIDIESWSWGETQSGSAHNEPGAPLDVASAHGGEGEPVPPGDTLPQEHVSLNFSEVESTDPVAAAGGSGSGQAHVQDLSLTKLADKSSVHLGEADDSLTAGGEASDPDHPVIVGSVYNAEDTGGNADYGYMDDDIPSGAPPPSDGVQDGLSNTVLVSEATDEPDLAGNEPPEEGNKLFVGGLSSGTDDAAPGGGQNEVQFEDAPGTEEADSHGMGSPYIKMAAFDNTMDPSGDPDDLVADGNDERPSSPKLVKPLVNNEVPASDDAHEIEMDVHVGRSEPDDVMTDQDPQSPAKGSSVNTGWDIQRNEES